MTTPPRPPTPARRTSRPARAAAPSASREDTPEEPEQGDGQELAPAGLRRDAARNRERILSAARRVFRAEGVEASMASVAREAGVGIATLFRRFPTKEDLVAGVFADRMAAHSAAVAVALDNPDPWEGLVGFVETTCAMQAEDYGFADVLTTVFPTARGLEQARDEAYHQVVELLDRAKDAGRLREDFTPEDLVLLYMANAGVINAAGAAAANASRRVVALMLQAFQAPSRAPLPAPPGPRTLYKAMAASTRGARHC